VVGAGSSNSGNSVWFSEEGLRVGIFTIVVEGVGQREANRRKRDF